MGWYTRQSSDEPAEEQEQEREQAQEQEQEQAAVCRDDGLQVEDEAEADAKADAEADADGHADGHGHDDELKAALGDDTYDDDDDDDDDDGDDDGGAVLGGQMLSMLRQLTPDARRRATDYVAQLLEQQRAQEPGQQVLRSLR